MIGIALDRTLSRIIACSDVRQAEQGDTSHGRQDKAGFPASGTSFLSFLSAHCFRSVSDVPSR